MLLYDYTVKIPSRIYWKNSYVFGINSPNMMFALNALFWLLSKKQKKTRKEYPFRVFK